jgi:exodeoxyribonuclease V gamma subunit
MLHIHRSERADGLVEALGALLLEPLSDPFAPELISVPTRGMERWLTQRMSGLLGATTGRSDGVCANVVFPFPRVLVEDAVAAASGIEPDADAWRPERAVWPLLALVEECIEEPWLRSLAAHLGRTAADGDATRRARRFSSVNHIATLFDRYALHRPEMVRAWAAGEDVDGSGAPLVEDAAWQAELWRRLRDRLGQPSPAERLESACARLRTEPALAGLPPRLSLFGLTRLPPARLDVLRALAEHRDVHLFLLHPSPALWDAIAPPAPVVRREQDPTVDLAHNRLLASWGQDAREMQLVLADREAAVHHHAVEHRSGTLLARIQADIRENRPPAGPDATRPLLDEADESLRIHACHGRARQVEVVRDAILHALREDPTLEPRDVIVMCPDIETFAPLIHATFGAGEAPEGEELETLPADVRPVDLKVRLADRALRQTNPVLGVVARLLDLASERITASQLLDLADREPVRRRFRFDDDDLTRLQDWIADSGIRWGLDAAHRAPFKLASLEAGTWRFGLDRVLVGVTMTDDELRRFGGVLPLDDVESGAIDLAGRLAEFVERVGAAVDALATPKPIDVWAEAIATAAESLTATADRDAWQRAELQRLLDDVVAEAAVADEGRPVELELPELLALLAGRLEGRPTRANFRTGHLTICTLVPMRSVPHRVVCLLGLDDGVFPRKGPRDGDDLMLDDPHVGDRDARIEDRQLLLDALLAAQDRLIITYTGNDERTNAPRPPAVPVGELLDVIDATVRVEHGAARDRVVVHHPLQPFDPRNFEAGRLMPGRRWSFDRVTLDGARALTGPRDQPGPFLPDPLPPAASGLVEVEDLVAFAQHPVRAFLRQRLGISVRDSFEDVEDDLPVELDGLDRWGVGQRLVDALLAGVDGQTAYRAEIARGSLPPGRLGIPVVQDVLPIAEHIVKAAAELDSDAASGSLDVRVLLDGRSLTGTVPGVAGDMVRTVTYSRLSAKHRVAAWVRLLALTAAYPERPFTAATVGRAQKDATVAIARIGPLGDDADGRRATALGHLATLLDLYDRGMREPLPLYCLASAAYSEAAAGGANPVAAARKTWTSEWNFDKEDKDAEHQLVLGGVRTLDDLLAEPPRPDEEGEGWEVTETTRVGRLARRMWDGLHASERIELR